MVSHHQDETKKSKVKGQPVGFAAQKRISLVPYGLLEAWKHRLAQRFPS
jgi:hypothetical protein